MLGIRTDRIKPANPSHLYHVAAFVTSVLATCSSQDFYHALIATSLHQPSLLSTTLSLPPPCTNPASSLPRSYRHLLAPTKPPLYPALIATSLHQPSLLSTTLSLPPPCTNPASSLPRSYRHLLAPTKPPLYPALIATSLHQPSLLVSSSLFPTQELHALPLGRNGATVQVPT